MATTGNRFQNPGAASRAAVDEPFADSTASSAAELMREIERRIATGELSPGYRLPPVRDAARQLSLAPNTVSRAYRTLQDRGLAYGEGRRGTFVADRPASVSTVDEPAASDLIDLAAGNPDPALLPDLGIALSRIATDHVAYGHAPIDQGLAQALQLELGPDLAPRVDAELQPGVTLAVVGGALDGIERTLIAHLRPGDRVAVEDPAYSSVLNLLSALNLRAVPVQIDERGPLPEHFERALSAGVAATIITPRAQNPTGAAIDSERADRLAGIAAEHPDVLIIEDDHAGRVAGVPYECAIPPTARRWAVIRSVAKSLGPDLRLAALAGDETTINRVTGRQLLGTGWVSHILQRTVAELLTAEETAPALKVASDTYRERRRVFADRLAAGGVSANSTSGLNVWVPVDDEATVVAAMQLRGYAIRSGARYRQLAPPAVRVSTAAADIETLVGAADAMLEVLGGGTLSRSV